MTDVLDQATIQELRVWEEAAHFTVAAVVVELRMFINDLPIKYRNFRILIQTLKKIYIIRKLNMSMIEEYKNCF